MYKKITNFIEKYGLFVVAIFLIFYVSFINIFPKDYIFSGGDAAQFFNFPKILRDFNFTWSNLLGEGFFFQNFSYNIYYIPFYLINYIFHTSPYSQSFLYYFIFLLFSFWSFYFGLNFYKKYDDKLNKNYLVIFSLLYTFNSYTFYNFYFIWGYSPFLFLYVLIPVIFGTTFKFFCTFKVQERNRLLAILGILFFLSSIANGNFPFFISLNIFLFLFIILIFSFRDKGIRVIDFLKNIFLYYVTYFLCVFWSIIPQIPEMFRQLGVFNNRGSVFDLKQWLFWQAVKLKDIFFINTSTFITGSNLSFLAYFSIIVFIIALLLMVLVKKKTKVVIIYTVLLVLDIFLINKGTDIFNNDFVWKIFNNPILSSLRSYDKTAIFLPFFAIIIIFLNIKSNFNRYKYILIILLSLNFLSVYPFFIGGIQTRYSIGFNNGKNYLNAEYSYMHKIPQEYFDLVNNLNKERFNSKVFGVPYNVINSVGWVNYPKWGVVGADPTIQLFNNPVVQMNSFGVFGTWNYGEFWNKQNNKESLWILPFSGFINSRYIIYHKDVAENFIEQTKDKIKFYESNKLISKIDTNDYFNAYRIDAKYYLPHLYTPQTFITTSQSIEILPEIVSQPDYKIRSAIYFNNPNQTSTAVNTSAISSEPVFNPSELKIETINNTPIIEFKKINPTKYRVIIHHATENFPLVFSESFHDDWKSYFVDYQKTALNFNETDYKILDGNSDDQASAEELKNYINSGYISSLGNLKTETIKHVKWVDNREVFDYNENYKIDFISKNFQDTIQNDNLAPGSFYETWFKKPVADNQNHLMVNGYANSWNINPNELCGALAAETLCVRNADGSYDLELVVEFWPQRLFYIGLFISGATLFGCLGYLGWDFVKRKRKKEQGDVED